MAKICASNIKLYKRTLWLHDRTGREHVQALSAGPSMHSGNGFALVMKSVLQRSPFGEGEMRSVCMGTVGTEPWWRHNACAHWGQEPMKSNSSAPWEWAGTAPGADYLKVSQGSLTGRTVWESLCGQPSAVVAFRKPGFPWTTWLFSMTQILIHLAKNIKFKF